MPDKIKKKGIFMEFDEVLFTRRSIRQFDASKKVSKEQIEKILEAAMYAPSACNCRPWQFVAVNEPLMLSKIMRVHPYCAFLKDAGAAIVVCADTAAQFKSEEGEGYYPADCAAATQNILLKAREMGLGTCWCGIYPVESRMKDFAKVLGLSKGVTAFSRVVVGYPAAEFGKAGARAEWGKADFSHWK